jgi:hypothetical protein
MADVSAISSLATGGGTLVLAIATFASVRSANRAARAAERSLLAGIRPLAVPSRLEDPPEKVGFADNHWIVVPGGHAAAEAGDDAVYLAIVIKNAGNGIAVLDRWYVHAASPFDRATPHKDPAEFRRLTRDLYIPANELGFWQGTIRDNKDPDWGPVRALIGDNLPISIDLLYADLEGGQRTITRFTMIPKPDGTRLATVSHHWFIDQANPR